MEVIIYIAVGVLLGFGVFCSVFVHRTPYVGVLHVGDRCIYMDLSRNLDHINGSKYVLMRVKKENQSTRK